MLSHRNGTIPYSPIWLTALVISLSLSTACGSMTRHRVPTEARQPSPRQVVVHRPAPTPIAKPTTEPFPMVPEPATLAQTYEMLTNEFGDFADGVDDCQALRHGGRSWLGTRALLATGGFRHLAARVKASLAEVSHTFPEVRTLLADVDSALLEGGAQQLGSFDALMWLALQAAATERCVHRTDPATSLAMSLIRWATTPELVYQSLFHAFAELQIPRGTTGAPLFSKNEEAAGLSALLFAPTGVVRGVSQTDVVFAGPRDPTHEKQSRDSSPAAAPSLDDWSKIGGPPATVKVASTAAPIRCERHAALSLEGGSVGAGNGLADAGEVMKLRLRCRNTSDRDWLKSESLRFTKVPDCVLGLPVEVTLPEVKPGESFTVDTPAFLVSGLCAEEIGLQLQIASSHFPPTSVQIDLSVRRSSWQVAIELDQDPPGSSDAAAVKGALNAGEAAELNFVGVASDGLAPELVTLRPLLGGDAERLRWSDKPIAGAMTRERARWRSVDDVDLQVADATTQRRALRRRGSTSFFARAPDRVWLAVQTTARLAPPSQGAAHGNATGGAQSLALFRAWRGVSPQLTRTEFSEIFLKMLMSATSALDMNALAHAVSPSYDDTVSAVTQLIDWGLLTGPTLGQALTHLDALRAAGVGHPVDRELARRLVIAAVAAKRLSDEERAYIFRTTDFLEMPPAKALVQLSSTLTHARVAHILEARLGAKSGPLVAKTVQRVMAMTSSAAGAHQADDVFPTIGGPNYVFTRYLPLSVPAPK